MTWDDCVREAAEAHPRVAAARSAAEAARSGVAASRSAYLPAVSVVASQSRSNTVSGTPGVFSAPVSDAMSVGPTASYNLFNGFASSGDLSRAKADRRGAELDETLAEAQARFDLRQAFGALLSAQETLALTEDIAKRLKANADFIKLRYQGGSEARWGWLKADADAKQAAWDRDRARLQLRAAQRGLASALGRPGADGLRADGSLDAPGPEPLEGALKRLDEQPSVRRQAETAESARGTLEVARAGWWPSFDVTAAYAKQGVDWTLADHSWSVGGALSYPLFSGDKTAATVEQSKSLLAAERQRLMAVRNDAASLLERTWADYRSAADDVPVAAAELEAEKQRASTVQGLYANGRTSFFEWDSAQSSYTSAQKAEAQARLSAYQTRASWEQALGRGLDRP